MERPVRYTPADAQQRAGLTLPADDGI